MVNNYIKVSHYAGEEKNRRVDSQLFPFDDADSDSTARAFADAYALNAFRPGTVSIFRRFAGSDAGLPVIGEGGGFS